MEYLMQRRLSKKSQVLAKTAMLQSDITNTHPLFLSSEYSHMKTFLLKCHDLETRVHYGLIIFTNLLST